MKDDAFRGSLQPFSVRSPGWACAQDWLAQAHARSLAFGLRPEAPVNLQPLLAADLSDAQEQHHLLCTHARPVMETLAEQLRDTQSMVVLTDAQGVILHAQGDDDFLGRAGRVALRPGAVWSEQDKGTNAIGTALAQGQPLQVLGAQHFLQANQFLACSCAPIRSPHGDILGALDVSGDPQGHSPHTLALVRMSAALVENQLFNTLYAHALRVRFHANAQLLGTLLEGWAAFSDEGFLLASNRSAQAQWGASDAALRQRPFEALLGRPWWQVLQDIRQQAQRDARLRLTLPTGIAVQACLEVPPAWLQRQVARERWQPADADPAGAPGRSESDEQRQAPHVPQAPSANLLPRASAPQLERLHAGDARMQTLVGQVACILGHDVPLLLQGETGTGKEWLARAYHQDSPRAAGPFVAVNCGAVPEHLIESELFGYEEGAFTGARRRGQIGQIERAQGGTLFLDEIGDMPLALQARLLRVLQEREVVPLGAARPRPVDMRVVCATHRDLRQRMAQGLFREDLYYRIHGLCVQLPALREREDFEGLVQQVLCGTGLPVQRVHPQAMALLKAHAWPGNLRELNNVLQLASLLAQGSPWIATDHLPAELQYPEGWGGKRQADAAPISPISPTAPRASVSISPSMPVRLGEVTQQALAQALSVHGGNISAAARTLGVSRNTIYRYLRTVRH